MIAAAVLESVPIAVAVKPSTPAPTEWQVQVKFLVAPGAMDAGPAGPLTGVTNVSPASRERVALTALAAWLAARKQNKI